jgi:glyoxylase-like metal-dependent hydrolase (beta-lactamase superfamily II)
MSTSAAVRIPSVNDDALKPVQVAPGVFVFESNNSTENSVDGNSTYIIGSKAVLVVDAPSGRLTTQHLAWLRTQTKLPVRYLVNTHWHPDHTRGNYVLADSFPGLAILASEFTKRIGDRKMPVIVARTREPVPDSMVEGMRRQIATARDDQGKELQPYQVERMKRSLAYFLREAPYMRELKYVGPNQVIDSEHRIELGGKTVIIRRFPGHTLGDLVVTIPNDGVLVAGDLVVFPVPYGTGQTVFRLWSRSLAELEKTPGVKTIVPGHGTVLHSWSYVRLERQAVDSLVAQAEAAVRDGLTFDQAKARINMSLFRQEFAGSDPDKQWAFDNYFMGIRRAFDEANGFVE